MKPQDLFELDDPGGETRLVVTRDFVHTCLTLEWDQRGERVARAKVAYEHGEVLCELHANKQTEMLRCAVRGNAIHSLVRKLLARFPARLDVVKVRDRVPGGSVRRGEPASELVDRGEVIGSIRTIAGAILAMAQELQRQERSPLAHLMRELDPEAVRVLQREERRLQKERERREAIEARVRQTQARKASEARLARRAAAAPAAEKRNQPAELAAPARPARAVPPVPLHVQPWHWVERSLDFGGSSPAEALRSFQLVERASQLWVSNQSDDLLCLPYCSLERFEYQVRSALRVIGPLRGRALLSDEVGLGKTIEAGLVLKEYITRGMVRRFLVVTMPSLVDQWQEELESKFALRTVTTNSAGWRADPAAFWTENEALVVSLHTLKIEPHLTHAQQTPWDMLIVDEAHHLRNQSSKAWQAISALPRQFLLLLTATPVQNSLDELYNLVTLLRPGQLPPPGEFARRFIDPKEPRRPREPEELRVCSAR
ncbi:MAG: DEAD/DEAH box helicase [Verrucomicrobiota bacterium]|nr:DEAD/DEAH box helicase [Verrucomicrobiota bacterium]